LPDKLTESSLCLLPLEIKDLPLLTQLSKECFDFDKHYFKYDTPSGYDHILWHKKMLETGSYYKIIYNKQMIGGILIFSCLNQVYNIGRIFLSPGFQNRGIGKKVLLLVEKLYPDAQKWVLDTPEWALKNQNFYEKNGYSKTRIILAKDQSHKLLIYEKKVKF